LNSPVDTNFNIALDGLKFVIFICAVYGHGLAISGEACFKTSRAPTTKGFCLDLFLLRAQASKTGNFPIGRNWESSRL